MTPTNGRTNRADALAWLASRTEWERLLDELRRTADAHEREVDALAARRRDAQPVSENEANAA